MSSQIETQIDTPRHPAEALAGHLQAFVTDGRQGVMLAPGTWHLAPGTWHLAPGTTAC